MLGSEGVVKVMFLYEMLKWRPGLFSPLKKPAERKTLSSSVHERERESKGVCERVYIACVRVCMCVCVRERE